MSNRHFKTLNGVLSQPAQAGIIWRDIEKALIAIGAKISEGSGSRVRISLNGVRAVFHRPHPRKDTDRGAIASMRRFLIKAGVEYVDI